MSNYPILYSFRRCPYAMRARIGILHAGLKVELREITLRNKPQQMLDISPKATIPVLQLTNGQIIDESLDILLWALAKNDPNNLLKPELKPMLKLIEQTDGSNDGHFKFHLDRYKYSTRYDNEDAQQVKLKARTTALEFIKILEDKLSTNSQLFGAEQSLADIAIAPFIRQFANSDRIWWDKQPYPHTQNWLNTFIASPLFQKTFKKFPIWQNGALAVYFP